MTNNKTNQKGTSVMIVTINYMMEGIMSKIQLYLTTINKLSLIHSFYQQPTASELMLRFMKNESIPSSHQV